jgi:tRNA pseudouridine38-40 synthase
MPKYKLTIAYDGTCYGGWQVQINCSSIQQSIETVLSKILQHSVSLVGSGRTDAGVHALAQVAHFVSEKQLCCAHVRASLNSLLPLDIRIMALEEVSSNFHARFDALSKEYHYHLHLSKARNPFKRLYSHHVLRPLDLALIEQALPYFVGTHNFSSFSNDCTEGSCGKNPVRTLFSLKMLPEEEGVRLEFQGNGFLYKMVRNITGTLLEVGLNNIDPTTIPTIFEKKERKAAGPAAPALGLFLVNVRYPEKS